MNNKLQVNVYVNTESLKIGDYGITDKIAADVIIDLNSTNNEQITIKNIVTTLTVRDLSFPIEMMIRFVNLFLSAVNFEKAKTAKVETTKEKIVK